MMMMMMMMMTTVMTTIKYKPFRAQRYRLVIVPYRII